jgi:site-specific DNA-methyltransferase (adenine-specific)
LAGSPPGGLVLDPFFGAGTVGIVARELERHYVGLELNPSYLELARQRLREAGCP